MKTVDGKSLVVGFLLGACLCLLLLLVHESVVGPAVAAVAVKQPPRYQLVVVAMPGPRLHLLDQNTGVVYRTFSRGPGVPVWKKWMKGPTP